MYIFMYCGLAHAVSVGGQSCVYINVNIGDPQKKIPDYLGIKRVQSYVPVFGCQSV